ncbi:MAG: GTP-binding protein [Promethearchaeota archaeon]
MDEPLKNILIEYIALVPGILAALITDRADFNNVFTQVGEEPALNSLKTFLGNNNKAIIDQFGLEYSFLEVLSDGHFKFTACSLGKSMFATIANQETTDIELKVYSVHLADIIDSFKNGAIDISFKIPGILRLFSKSKGGKIPKGQYSLKLVVVGNSQVGKTSLIRRFVEGEFVPDSTNTTGFKIYKKNMKISEVTRINYVIWDTGGLTSQISPMKEKIYNFVDAVIIVIDLTKGHNSKTVSRWISHITESVLYPIPIMILGTKKDLVDDAMDNTNEIKKVAVENKLDFMLTSAKTGENINEAMIEITDAILNFLESQKKQEENRTSGKYKKYRISNDEALALEDLENTMMENLKIPGFWHSSHDLDNLKKTGFPRLYHIDTDSFGMRILNGKVVGLALFNCGLSYLPDSFKKLINLKELILRCNPLIDFPQQILDLFSLTMLDLALTGSMRIPKNIKKLSHLEVLHLENNMISTLPETIGDLKELRILHLENNPLKDLPYFFSNLTSLEELYMEGTSFFFRSTITELPRYFGNLSKLKELDLSSNNLKSLPESFGELKSLKFLNLYNNNLKHLPKSFEKLKKLEFLDLEENGFTKLPDSLKGLENLREIKLINNPLHKKGSKKFKALAFKASGREFDRLMKIAEACNLEEKRRESSKKPKATRIKNIVSTLLYAIAIAFIGLFTFLIFVDFTSHPSFIPIIWIFFFIALLINLFIGASIIQTLSSYVKVSVFVFRKKIYKLFDLLVVFLLVWSIRSTIKTSLYIELMPAVNFLFEYSLPNWLLDFWAQIGYNLELTFLENLDLFLGHFFLKLFSTGLVFWALFRNGIGHIRKTAFDERERKNIWLFLILGLFGAFSLAIMEYSTLKNILSISYNIGVFIGACVFIYEKNERNKTYLLVYLLLISAGIIAVWAISFWDIGLSLILGIVFIASFVLVRWRIHQTK